MSSRTESSDDTGPDHPPAGRFERRDGRTDGVDVSVAEPSREEVLRTVFGLGGHDVRTYDAVVEVPGSTTRELAGHLDRDRSNVNRSLNRLRDAGLVTRDRRLLDAGGHVYQYSAASDEAADDIISQAIDRWRSAAVDAVGAE